MSCHQSCCDVCFFSPEVMIQSQILCCSTEPIIIDPALFSHSLKCSGNTHQKLLCDAIQMYSITLWKLVKFIRILILQERFLFFI